MFWLENKKITVRYALLTKDLYSIFWFQCIWPWPWNAISDITRFHTLEWSETPIPLSDIKPIFHISLCSICECSGSVVECLTRDQRAAGSSLTCVTASCPWARHINPCLVLVQLRKTHRDKDLYFVNFWVAVYTALTVLYIHIQRPYPLIFSCHPQQLRSVLSLTLVANFVNNMDRDQPLCVAGPF